MIRKAFNKVALLFGLTIFGLALSVPANAAAEEVNVYSARKAQLIAPLLEDFSAQTGIQVNLITGKADALLKRLQLEGKNSPADVLVTTDAGRLYRAQAEGVLQAAMSAENRQMVPANLQDKSGYWLGLTKRSRVIVYAKDRVDPNELSSYEALADSKWKGRICVRSSNNIYNQSLVASMLAQQGPAATEKWAQGFVSNFARKPRGGDRDQIKAVAAGLCDIALVNTYYLGKMINGKDAAQQQAADKVALFWPNQNDRGAHINISGIAITQSAQNIDNANKLIQFMLSKQAQTWYAQVNNEYPVITDAELSETLQNWGDFKGDEINLEKLGELNAQAVKLMDRAGWR